MPSRSEYFKKYALEHKEKMREHKREWARRKRGVFLIKEGKCQRCEMLLKYGGGNGLHCAQCLTEM